MEIGHKINWLVTDRCNLSCSYCFAPRDDLYSEGEVVRTAGVLAESGVKKVTLSGGEPALVDGLENVVEILGKGGVHVSLHTNGFFLDKDMLRKMKPYVGDVYLSVDSMDEGVNDAVRGAGSLEAFERAFDLLNGEGVRTGVHTVATPHNILGLDKVRDYISKGDFFDWKIYECNERPLCGDGDLSLGALDGDVGDFFGDFLLAEARIGKGDGRIGFVANEDRMPYLFLNNGGGVSYHPWFVGKGKCFGNVFDDKLGDIVGNVKSFVDSGSDAEDFFKGKWQLPLWARYYEGNFELGELEKIEPKYWEKFLELSALYEKRVG